MWISSWNEKYEDTLKFDIGSNNFGYVISENGNEYNTNIYVNNHIGFNDTLYFNHPNTEADNWNGCTGYWLSSPSDYGGINNDLAEYLMVINNTGNVGYRGCAATYYGLRPVICLKSNVNGSYNNNKWTLSI